MNLNSPVTPSYIFGYWRPWKEDSNLIDSYLDYNRDVSLAKYSADTIGQYITSASTNHLNAISELGNKLGIGIDALSNQLSDIYAEISFINKNLELQIEQNKMANLLLENIFELLKVPENEKERQFNIELGLKFFSNAKKDPDLFKDALDEFLKAEQLMKQDYFVLHRIGMIYLYSLKEIDPQQAYEYFVRAAKYASVESDISAIKLVSILKLNSNAENVKVYSDSDSIMLLAADSFEKAAFAAYVLGNYSDAVTSQLKAVQYNNTPENLFFLSKYYARAKDIDLCIESLDSAIKKKPSILLAVFKEIDLINEPRVLELLKDKDESLNKSLSLLSNQWERIKSNRTANVLNDIAEIINKDYLARVVIFEKYIKLKQEIQDEFISLNKTRHSLLYSLDNIIYPSLGVDEIATLKRQLIELDNCSLEDTREIIKKVNTLHESNKLAIGSCGFGGIVFYIDESGKHGLVACEKEIGRGIWGTFQKVGTSTKVGSGKSNSLLILEKASSEDKKGFFKSTKTKINTAASTCLSLNVNGYSDWYLPSLDELTLIYNNLSEVQIILFSKMTEDTPFWSSSESKNPHEAYVVYLSDGMCLKSSKAIGVYKILAIRSF